MMALPTTDDDAGNGGRHAFVVTLTTGAVAVLSASTVAWAAVTTVHTSAPINSVQPQTRAAGDDETDRQLLQERNALDILRRDLAALYEDADALPQPPANVGSATPASGYSTTYVPPSPNSAYVPPPMVNVQPAAPAAAPPPTQATTGATGVVVH